MTSGYNLYRNTPDPRREIQRCGEAPVFCRARRISENPADQYPSVRIAAQISAENLENRGGMDRQCRCTSSYHDNSQLKLSLFR